MLSNIPHWVLWLVVAIALSIVEISTLTLVTVWFAIGAVFAIIASLLGVPFFYQVVIFIVTSIVFLYFTKPVAKKYLMTKTVRTNADRVIGEKGIVIEKIDPISGSGQVKVRGQVWSARAIGDEEIDVEETVEIQEISGVRLIVKKATK